MAVHVRSEVGSVAYGGAIHSRILEITVRMRSVAVVEDAFTDCPSCPPCDFFAHLAGDMEENVLRGRRKDNRKKNKSQK